VKILIDGSNVLFWHAGQPDPDAPMQVFRTLVARRYAPVIYFDHTIHRYLAQSDLERFAGHADTVIVPRGTSADGALLQACENGRFQIVSADRFRAWRCQYPNLRGRWLVTGRIEKGGRASFSKKLRPVPL
jgi:hypothetical protein